MMTCGGILPTSSSLSLVSSLLEVRRRPAYADFEGISMGSDAFRRSPSAELRVSVMASSFCSCSGHKTSASCNSSSIIIISRRYTKAMKKQPREIYGGLKVGLETLGDFMNTLPTQDGVIARHNPCYSRLQQHTPRFSCTLQETESKLLPAALVLVSSRSAAAAIPSSSLEEAGHPEHEVPDVAQIPALERPPLPSAQREGRLRPTAGRQDMRRHQLRLPLLVASVPAAALVDHWRSPGPRDRHRRGRTVGFTSRRKRRRVR
ncbi:hypothetical protein BHM03_00025156 [Ensete ventricosum]|nr:hypothetical protein BHM03_00025156 [Ensete ventricosum]